MNNFDFMSIFKPETMCIKEFKYWIVCIRGLQTTLGDAVIILKREITSLSQMVPDESAEFIEVVKWYEDVCSKKFGAVKFNYIAMMMRDNFVHYHAFPRYDKPVNVFNAEWKDNYWPRSIDFKGGIELEEGKLQEMITYMKEN